MDPIVHGMKQQYGHCIRFERENFHADTPLHREYFPIASPEFFLLDAQGQVLGRWVGATEADALEEALSAVCE